MKTKHTTLKPSTIGTITAMLMAVSVQTSAAGESQPIWAGHFKEAYRSVSPQSVTSSSASNTSSVKDRLIWAGHFERAYGPSSERTDVVTGPGRQNMSQQLLWAGHFKQVYQPAPEEVIEGIGIEVAMDRN